jgi:hypothetical protein
VFSQAKFQRLSNYFDQFFLFLSFFTILDCFQLHWLHECVNYIIYGRVVDPDSFESGSRSGSSLFCQSGSGSKPNPDPNPEPDPNRIQTGSGLRKKAGSGFIWIRIHNPDLRYPHRLCLPSHRKKGEKSGREKNPYPEKNKEKEFLRAVCVISAQCWKKCRVFVNYSRIPYPVVSIEYNAVIST